MSTILAAFLAKLQQIFLKLVKSMYTSIIKNRVEKKNLKQVLSKSYSFRQFKL